ncbi:MAG: Bro-N domain-containing protein, partial [Clostridia bacterium]
MEELQVFKNDEFGEVRTLLIEGIPWFVGKDVADILGYKNPPKAIRDHVDFEDKTVNESFTVNG